jgi:hypothetical protein
MRAFSPYIWRNAVPLKRQKVASPAGASSRPRQGKAINRTGFMVAQERKVGGTEVPGFFDFGCLKNWIWDF